MSGYLQLGDGRVVPVRDGLVIGRVAGCDCVIDDGKASRRHARLVVEAGVVEIEDLKSSNGTLLNGKPVERRLLRAGDEIQIGKTVIVYRDGTPPGTRAASAPAAAVFDDGDDLFGGDTSTSTSPVAPPAPAPPPSAPAPIRSAPVVAKAPPPPPRIPSPPPAAPPPPAPAPTVVEFADEVVEVRRAPVAEPKKAAPAAAAGADAVVATGSRVLQFSKHSGSGGLLGDDLTQMNTGTRWLLYLGVLVLGAGIVGGIVWLMR